MPNSPDCGAVVDGCWQPAAQRCSPNCDARPPGSAIELLVIHSISLPAGQFDARWVDDLFMNCLDCTAHPGFEALQELEVSAHLLIQRDGRAIQYVPFHLRAWHAGISAFRGRDRCNDFSIGIELAGSDFTPFTDAQYQTLVTVTRAILREYPGISENAIVGHADIAPGRKTDPGPHFDWVRYRAALAASASPMATMAQR